MATFNGSEDLQNSEFLDANLRGSRVVRSSLSGAVMRGVDVPGVDIDSPWLLEGGGLLLVNGVDVAPFVEAELNRRFPGRELRRARDPEELREAWAEVERTRSATLKRVETMPAGSLPSYEEVLEVRAGRVAIAAGNHQKNEGTDENQ